MHLNQLKYFVAIAACRSFTRAAELQHLTQTALTQQIRALENELALELFNRQKRPVELTPAGKVFFQEAKAILARVDEAVNRAREASSGAVGTIRIGYEKGYERSELSARLQAFHKAYPNVLFTCLREDTDKLAEKLLADELDVIFAWDSTNLRANPAIGHSLDMKSQLSVALCTGHPYASRKSLRREDLREETILYMSPSGTSDSLGDASYLQLYGKAGYQPKILLKSYDLESILLMVAAEEGVAIVPSYSVAKLINADNLLFLPLEGEEEYEEIFMFWKKESHNSALQYFLGFIKA